MKIDGKTLGLLFELRDRLQDRVDGIPAQKKALPRYLSDGTAVKTVGHVMIALNVDIDTALAYSGVKVAHRRVRTPEGSDFYHLPIGALIPPGREHLPHIGPGGGGKPKKPRAPKAPATPHVPQGRYGNAPNWTPEDYDRVRRRLASTSPNAEPKTNAEIDAAYAAAVAARKPSDHLKPDVNPAGGSTNPYGRTPAVDDPFLVAMDAIRRLLPRTKPVIPRHDDLAGHLRDLDVQIRNGGNPKDFSLARFFEEAALREKDGSKVQRTLMDISRMLAKPTQRKWAAVPSARKRPVKPIVRGITFKGMGKRDDLGRIPDASLRRLPRTKPKAPGDPTLQSVHDDALSNMQRLLKQYQTAAIKAELMAYQNDLNQIRAEFRRRKVAPPMLPRNRKVRVKRTKKPLVTDGWAYVMSKQEVAEVEQLTAEQRKVYSLTRREDPDGGHAAALTRALEFHNEQTPKTLKLGRKIRTANGPIYKVQTAGGDPYVIRATQGNLDRTYWYVTYNNKRTGKTQRLSASDFRTPEAALAYLERWDDAQTQWRNAGKTRPPLPDNFPWNLGPVQSGKRYRRFWDTYNITDNPRGDTYKLIYDGNGWYTTVIPKTGPNKGKEIEVDGNYYKDGTEALRALVTYDRAYYSTRPIWERHAMSAQQRRVYDELTSPAKRVYARARDNGDDHAGAMKRVRSTQFNIGTRTGQNARRGRQRAGTTISERTVRNFVPYRDPTQLSKGDRIAVVEPSFGQVQAATPKNISDAYAAGAAELATLPVVYHTVKKVVPNYGWDETGDKPVRVVTSVTIHLVGGLKITQPVGPGIFVYRLKTNDEVRAEAAARAEAEGKDVFGGMVDTPGGLSGRTGTLRTPIVSRRRRRKAQDRARDIFRAAKLKDIAAFVDMYEEKKRKSSLPKTETCSEKDCKEKASVRVLWAEGMAYQPACPGHIEAVKKRIEDRNGKGEVVGTRDIKALVKDCTCCDGFGEHDTGRECYACDASGHYDGGPIPCDGTKPYEEKDIKARRVTVHERRVATAAGARFYGKPIGSVITEGVHKVTDKAEHDLLRAVYLRVFKKFAAYEKDGDFADLGDTAKVQDALRRLSKAGLISKYNGAWQAWETHDDTDEQGALDTFGEVFPDPHDGVPASAPDPHAQRDGYFSAPKTTKREVGGQSFTITRHRNTSGVGRDVIVVTRDKDGKTEEAQLPPNNGLTNTAKITALNETAQTLIKKLGGKPDKPAAKADDNNPHFKVGQKVETEYGKGTVKAASDRRVYIELDDGQSINVATGTPGYDRLRKANEPLNASVKRPREEQRRFGIAKDGNTWHVTSEPRSGVRNTPVRHDGTYKTQREATAAANRMERDYNAGGELPKTVDAPKPKSQVDIVREGQAAREKHPIHRLSSSVSHYMDDRTPVARRREAFMAAFDQMDLDQMKTVIQTLGTGASGSVIDYRETAADELLRVWRREGGRLAVVRMLDKVAEALNTSKSKPTTETGFISAIDNAATEADVRRLVQEAYDSDIHPDAASRVRRVANNRLTELGVNNSGLPTKPSKPTASAASDKPEHGNIDTRGNTIDVGDRVRVTAVGYGARLSDAGREGTIDSFSRTRIVVTMDDGRTLRLNRGEVMKTGSAPASTLTVGKKTKDEIDGWDLIPVKGKVDYGVLRDPKMGWYAVFSDTEDDVDGVYYKTSDEAIEAIRRHEKKKGSKR